MPFEYYNLEGYYATQLVPNPRDTSFTPMKLDELVGRQTHHQLCTEIQRHLNDGEGLAYEINDNIFLNRNVRASLKIVVPNVLKQHVL